MRNTECGVRKSIGRGDTRWNSSLRTPRSSLLDFEDDLSRLSALDRVNGFVGLFEGKAVGDHRRGVELTGAEEAGHLVPGVVHATPDDTINGDALEDHLGREAHFHRLGGNPEHLHASPDPYQRKRLMNGGGNSGHLQHDVDAESGGMT